MPRQPKTDRRLCDIHGLEQKIIAALEVEPLSTQQIQDITKSNFKLRTIRYHLTKLTREKRIRAVRKLSNMRQIVYILNKETEP